LQFQGKVKQFVTVDTTQSVDEVARQVSRLIMDFYVMKMGTRDGLSESEVE
jgi:hypothetical protein